MLAFYQSYHYNDKRADLCFIRYDKAHTYIFWYIIRQLHRKQDRGSWWESGTVPQLYGELSHGKSVTRTWEARNSVKVPACFYCRKPGSFKVRDMGWLLEAVLAKSVKRRSASQRNEKNVRLQKSIAWEKPRSRASLRDQTYDFPENRKAIEWIAADTERAFVPWNGYTAQPAFLRLFCIGRRDGDEEKAPFLQGKRGTYDE